MLNWPRAPVRRAITAAVAFAPWLASMYLFFWLHDNGVWTPETPHRGKLSVALLASGMLGSFVLQSYIEKRRQQ